MVFNSLYTGISFPLETALNLTPIYNPLHRFVGHVKGTVQIGLICWRREQVRQGSIDERPQASITLK